MSVFSYICYCCCRLESLLSLSLFLSLSLGDSWNCCYPSKKELRHLEFQPRIRIHGCYSKYLRSVLQGEKQRGHHLYVPIFYFLGPVHFNRTTFTWIWIMWGINCFCYSVLSTLRIVQIIVYTFKTFQLPCRDHPITVKFSNWSRSHVLSKKVYTHSPNTSSWVGSMNR